MKIIKFFRMLEALRSLAPRAAFPESWRRTMIAVPGDEGVATVTNRETDESGKYKHQCS